MSTTLDCYRQIIASDSEAITWACTLEAAAPKFGNVHPTASFDDLEFTDFAAAAKRLADSCLDESQVGSIILRAVQGPSTGQHSNINLGIALLIAPLYRSAHALRVSNDQPRGPIDRVQLRSALAATLGSLTAEDAEGVYEAIRSSNPGGLGSSKRYDVRDPQSAPPDLIEAMREAESRDLIAKQYTSNFETVFQQVIPAIEREVLDTGDLLLSVRHAQLKLLAELPDSLIARKCGMELAISVQQKARELIPDHDPEIAARASQIASFDRWLRADRNRRNPGAIADLIAAALFVIFISR